MKRRVIQVRSENNHFQHAEVLKRNRVKRQQYGEFYVEGVMSINRAIANAWPMSTLIYSTERRLSKWAHGVIETASAETHLVLPLSLMDKLSDKEEPSELLAILEMPPDDLKRIPVKGDLVVLVCDRPSNPGNLGAIIRSSDALKADGLVITGHSIDLYDPQTIRASMGSLFALPVVRIPSHRELVAWLDEIRRVVGGVQFVGTSAKAETDLTDVDWTAPTVLAVGNETLGLSNRYKELCDLLVRIPIYGSATSLNVACAASVLLYEIDRQRRAHRSRSNTASDGVWDATGTRLTAGSS
jgi:tRNA G18 (ribose-2'-O)-methylase SpoU